MATIHFNDYLCQKAIKLIETKSSIDKVKAYNDLVLVNSIIAGYENGQGYNQKVALDLDERIRREHQKTINRIDSTPSPDTFMPKGNSMTMIDPLIERLKVDRFGIMYDVLKNEGIVHEIEEFIESVE